jgi:hypothetical protein
MVTTVVRLTDRKDGKHLAEHANLISRAAFVFTLAPIVTKRIDNPGAVVLDNESQTAPNQKAPERIADQ